MKAGTRLVRRYEVARILADRVGLARMEFVFAGWAGIHPLALTRFESLPSKTKLEVARRTRGYEDKAGFFARRLLLGGVSTNVLRTAEGPVLICRAPRRSGVAAVEGASLPASEGLGMEWTRAANPEQLLEAARITMEASEYCFLVTSGAAGADVRLMQPFDPDGDLAVCFGTSPRSRKAREILADERVVLAYSDPTEVAYVVLKGTAALEDAPARKQRFWREEWRTFYPEGPEGDDYVLVRFVPDRVELMNFTREVTPPPYGLRPAVLARAGETWRLAREEE